VKPTYRSNGNLVATDLSVPEREGVRRLYRRPHHEELPRRDYECPHLWCSGDAYI